MEGGREEGGKGRGGGREGEDGRDRSEHVYLMCHFGNETRYKAASKELRGVCHPHQEAEDPHSHSMISTATHTSRESLRGSSVTMTTCTHQLTSTSSDWLSSCHQVSQ